MPPIVWMFIIFCVIAFAIGAAQYWPFILLAIVVGGGIWIAIKINKKQSGVRVSNRPSDNRV